MVICVRILIFIYIYIYIKKKGGGGGKRERERESKWLGLVWFVCFLSHEIGDKHLYIKKTREYIGIAQHIPAKIFKQKGCSGIQK